jgi:hypothetical protein
MWVRRERTAYRSGIYLYRREPPPRGEAHASNPPLKWFCTKQWKRLVGRLPAVNTPTKLTVTLW